MVSYTKYHSSFLKVSAFKYKSSFNSLNKKFSETYSIKNSNYNYRSNSIIRFSNDNEDRNLLNSTLNLCNLSTANNTNHTINIKNNLTAQVDISSLSNENGNTMNNSIVVKQKSKNDFYLFNSESSGNLKINKIFYNDSQSVLCEAKGRLTNFFKKSEDLKYLITTYGGQSGSPIFFRIKRKYLNNAISNKKPSLNSHKAEKLLNEYEYIFLGIHSRCSKDATRLNPKCSLYPNTIKEDDSDLILEKDSSGAISMEGEIIMKKNHKQSKFNPYSNSDIKDSFLSKTLYTNYNLGLKLSSKLVDNLKKMILKKRSDLGFILNNSRTSGVKSNKSSKNLVNIITSIPQSSYIHLNLYTFDDILFSGMFHKQSILLSLFETGEALFKIPAQHIYIRDHCNKTYSYEKDHSITIQQILTQSSLGEENNFLNTYSFLYELDVEKYGIVVANKLLKKLKDFDDQIEKKLAKKEKNVLIKTVKYIFDEIQFLHSKSIYFHGLLFKVIKEKLFDE